jgi:hypothetical protein
VSGDIGSMDLADAAGAELAEADALIHPRWPLDFGPTAACCLAANAGARKHLVAI